MDYLKKICDWAMGNPDIRVLILSGSRARNKKSDELSDYDIAVYGNNFPFLHDDDWLKEIDNYWICIHDSFQLVGYQIPSRLTIFEGGVKVDFSFHPIESFQKIVTKNKLIDDYDIGYRVLLDKDGLTQRIPKAQFDGFKIKKPGNEDFIRNQKNFWFEIYHVAKYLAREDLWVAKYRDWSAKEYLREMLEWNCGAQLNWNMHPNQHGKNMKNWIDDESWEGLFSCFSNLSRRESWQAMENTMILYRKITISAASKLNYSYLDYIDASISDFTGDLKSSTLS